MYSYLLDFLSVDQRASLRQSAAHFSPQENAHASNNVDAHESSESAHATREQDLFSHS